MAECQAELRTANFYRDKLAERLYIVETAVVELESALSHEDRFDPGHWRHHVESALEMCKRATRKVRYKADPLSDPTSGQGADSKPGLSDA